MNNNDMTEKLNSTKQQQQKYPKKKKEEKQGIYFCEIDGNRKI